MQAKQDMLAIGQAARKASHEIAIAPTEQKNTALLFIAEALIANEKKILSANQRDAFAAQQAGYDEAFLNRLSLNPTSISLMTEGLQQIAALPDIIGKMDDFCYRPSGIQIGKMRVPLGVVCMIYESRPNVTADASGLCIKSGNAVILRGGSEAIHSNQAIAECVQQGLSAARLPIESVQLIKTTERAAISKLLVMDKYIDVIVPRGGKGLVEHILQISKIPLIKHLDGNCHVFIDESADKTKAINIAINAKTQRYGTCNSMETLLVHSKIAEQVLPALAKEYWARNVELRGCQATVSLLGERIKIAQSSDWDTEYLAPILAIKIVSDLSEAITQINNHGSHHTDAIVTENYSNARRFLAEVDSSSVMVNASTRFADGFEYGLGAEIGISTDKIHARGPVGLEGLTSQKWIVLGNGQIREK